jgi:hypothetical protein
VPTLVLLALLAAAPAPDPAAPPAGAQAPEVVASDVDSDFASDFAEGTPGLALGPLPPGQFIASVDLGWLRSAVRGQVGMGRDFDFVFWVDAFLLDAAFDAQNGLHAGVRYTPLQGGPFRLTLEGTAGAVFIAGRIATSNLFALRGEATAGVSWPDLGTVYARLQIRGLTDAAAGGAHWGRDAELGAGVERNVGRFTFGAEAFRWTRPELEGLTQWRIRVGYQL